MKLQELKFPIGEFKNHEDLTATLLLKYLKVLKQFPLKLRQETINLNSLQLDTRYREEGWTIRQVVHHCADSHMNCFIRFKLAVTEHRPIIRPYNEALWAELGDSKMPINPALTMLNGIHQRWIALLRSYPMDIYKNSFYHPEQEREITLGDALGYYAWHCEHHLAHIKKLKERKGWQ
jgi:hypothetical protein